MVNVGGNQFVAQKMYGKKVPILRPRFKNQLPRLRPEKKNEVSRLRPEKKRVVLSQRKNARKTLLRPDCEIFLSHGIEFFGAKIVQDETDNHECPQRAPHSPYRCMNTVFIRKPAGSYITGRKEANFCKASS